MKRKMLMALVMALMFLSICVSAKDFLPETDGSYSVSYTASEYGEYVLTCIKGTYATQSEALLALYSSTEKDINFFDTKRADEQGNVIFDKIVPVSFVDSSVFISGKGLEKPIYVGNLLANGKSDIANVVFVGIEEKYIVNGLLESNNTTEKVTAYTEDSFGFPTLSNPTVSLTLAKNDEDVSFSSDGTLCISSMASGGEYTIQASLEDGFSDSFIFTVERAKPVPYTITVYRPDAHDRQMTKAELVGVEGVYPAFSAFAKTKDQFGNDFADEYTYFVDNVEYPDHFTPTDEGTYKVFVASKNKKDVRKEVTVVVTNRPDYTGNAFVLYNTILAAQKELDKIGYEVFVSVEEGRDVFETNFWTTKENVQLLKNSILNAEDVLSTYLDATTTENEYQAATNALSASISTYIDFVLKGCRVDATKITLSQTSISIPAQKYFTISATLVPAENTDVVTWSVSDPDILYVYNGSIYGYKKGEAEVIATTRSGLSERCRVNVYKPFKTLFLQQSRKEMFLGQQDQYILYTASPEDGGDKLTWTSSDESVATIEPDGRIVAYKQGTTTITATNIDKSKTTTACVLEVQLPADTVTLDVEQSLVLNKQDTVYIKGVASRLDGLRPTNTKIMYEIIDSNPEIDGMDVVHVSQSGSLKAVSGGKARVRVTAVGAIGKVYKDIEINVIVPSTGISLSTLRKTMVEGKTMSLVATLLPIDATDDVSWYSTDETVATVDQEGTVTALSEGVTRIYVATQTGYKNYCTLIVGLGATDIEIISGKTAIQVGEGFVLNARAIRKDGRPCFDTSVSFSVIRGRRNISVNSNGVVNGVLTGTSTIRITAVNGQTNIQKDFVVTVCEKISDLSFTQQNKEMFEGQTFDFSTLIEALPETHSGVVTYESSDTRCLTVDDKGVVTAVAAGSARLYARSGVLSTYITVNVEPSASTVEILPAENTSLHFGQSLVLTAISRDKEGNIIDVPVIWQSSDESVVSVSSNGTVKSGTKQGKATITAKDITSSAGDSIEITVSPSLYTVSFTDDSVELEKGQSLDVLSLLLMKDMSGNVIDASNCTFSLRSRNEDTVLVDGTTITAKSNGNTSVRIIVYCGNISRSVNLKVMVNEMQQATLSFEDISGYAVIEQLVVEDAGEIGF